ncbi:MAG: biotin/lipoyl-binding protein, partial [Acidobacteriota bacterium]
MLKKIAVPLVILIIGAAFIFVKVKGSAKNAQNGIKLIKVERGDIVEKALAIGRVEPKKEIAIKSKISGIVREVFVEVGDKVKVGDPLFEVRPDPTPLEFAEAKRNVEMAAVSLEKAQADYGRQKQLLEAKLISPQDFEEVESEYKQSQLRLNVAQERLALIEKGRTRIADRLIDTIIKAPVDGTV